MYAIIGTGGKQYRVMRGDLLKIELLPPETEKVIFSEVYLVGSGQDTAVGNPLVVGAKVTGTVVGTGRLPKVLVFKMKRRKQYKRTIGHRQYFTSVRIEEIDSGGAVKPLAAEAAGTDGKPARKTARRRPAAKKKKTPARGKARAARKKATVKKTTAARRKKAGTKKPGTRKKATKKKTTKKKTTKKKTGRRS